MPKYLVASPLKVTPDAIALPGEVVELPAKEGDPLLTLGAVKPVLAEPAPGNVGPGDNGRDQDAGRDEDKGKGRKGKA